MRPRRYSLNKSWGIPRRHHGFQYEVMVVTTGSVPIWDDNPESWMDCTGSVHTQVFGIAVVMLGIAYEAAGDCLLYIFLGTKFKTKSKIL